MLRVIIADDHPIVLRGLGEVILEAFQDAVIDEASTAEKTISMIKENDYDLVVLDIALPDNHGLEVLMEIKKHKRDLPVLILSMYPEEQYAVQAIKAGSHGYVSKRSASDELVLAVRKILAGKRYISPAFAEEMLFNAELDAEKRGHERLSKREFQIACMIGKGKTIKEISQALQLSVNTVRTYRVRILRKIGAKGTNDLIRYTVKHGLVE
ncbi:MAG: Response regulator UvrY [Syntrophorhabdaceae bacterium PtaU1.Bin034]|jgi:DNA-binding NarL/FixJ family response regulator|nr:MAG: Response regulator UvrY [Syntrophorhabdaceae bacterium PtaU1.Bin034]